MPGSSSTTRILALELTGVSSSIAARTLLGDHGKQERKSASRHAVTFHPDPSPVRLDQAAGNRQAEPGTPRIPFRLRKPEEIVKNLQLILGGYARTRICHGDPNGSG